MCHNGFLVFGYFLQLVHKTLMEHTRLERGVSIVHIMKFPYLNLASLRLLLTIIAWEAKVVGEWNQSVWATCLIQCPSTL
jgi:hypothetical protein